MDASTKKVRAFMHNKLITRIILAYLALTAVAAPALWLYLSGTIEGFFTDRIAENLRAEAYILSGELAGLKAGETPRGLAARYKEATGARVTIIGPDGAVLDDSDEDPSRMENHLFRPEVQAALSGGWGRAVRYSHTIRIDMLYVAVAVKPGGGLRGFVRLSMPLHQVEEAMSFITRKVSVGAFVIFLAAAVLGIYLSRSITERVRELAAFTKAVSGGDFSGRVRGGQDNELGMLAENLNEMAVQLKDKMDSITVEKATLEAVLGGMVEGVLVADREGRVVLANRSLRETFGIRKEEALGRPFLEVIRNSELAGIINKAYVGHELVTGEVELLYPENLYFLASCVPLIVGGGFGGSVLVLHDVTRLKALERVRRDFVANVTHELKTPISAIQGFAETLLAGALDEKENARRFLGIIETNARRLTRLIEDLLTLSRIELGEVRLELRPVSIKNVCDEAAALLEPKAKEKGLRLVLDIPEDTPKALADRDKLYMVVLNVMDNAVKYTPEGGTVSVAARRPAGAEGMVEVSVSDTGVGIPPELLPRVGERFFRVDAARSRELGGTGLGLAIVKHIVKAHGGSFSIDSLPRKGTTVTLTFKAVTETS